MTRYSTAFLIIPCRAHHWIRSCEDDIQIKLTALNSDKCHKKCSNQNEVYNHNLSLLKRTTISSVALDESAILQLLEDSHIPLSESKQQDTSNPKVDIDSADSDSSQDSCIHRRKRIKNGAINAMAKDGIDIASCFPKTWDDIAYRIRKRQSKEESFSTRSQSLSSEFINEDDNDDVFSKPVDKLVILCSCGEEQKQRLSNLSKSVDEWVVDAPSTLVLEENGDPYHRVSLEIKSKVEVLMEAMIGRNMKEIYI